MQRIAAGVEYCGARYCGWQYQDNGDTVQAQIERALGAVADARVRVIAAGRTDTGVHACAQVIHFDTAAARAPQAWMRGVNTALPDDIALLWTQPVAPDFHARFSARERAYRYIILNRAAPPSYLHGRVAWVHAPLAVDAMRQAATAFVGRHDFTSLRAAGCQAKSPVREVRGVEVGHCGEWIWVDVRADGFLHRMVRNLVGVLLRIGEGRESVAWAAELLAARDRTLAAATAPAEGLYLVGVEYDGGFNLPAAAVGCRYW